MCDERMRRYTTTTFMLTLSRIASSVGVSEYALPSGASVRLTSLRIRFAPADPPRLEPGTLKSTYTTKPLVDIDGEPVFGELAIVRLLEKDGWTAVWADTFHGRKFWKDMPHKSEPVSPPEVIRSAYDRIAERKGGASGCFDVIAWKGDRVKWLEYKGPRDKPNMNEAKWIDAALQARVRAEDLVFVGDHSR